MSDPATSVDEQDKGAAVGRLFAKLYPNLDPESAVKAGRLLIQMTGTPVGMAHVLYRHLDVDGVLLYVGICQWAQKKTRQTTHANSARWWAFVERTEFEEYDDERAARAAESTAIAQEKPIFNLDRNGTPRAQRKSELAYIRSRICQQEHLGTSEGVSP